MDRRQLGRTGISVSAICLGSMTWGLKNTQDEGFQQLDRATDQGVDFIDTAEVYPVPSSAKTGGRTEEIIGAWLARSGKRNDLVLATKVAGGGGWTRGGAPIDADQIKPALDGSLRRLGTDWVDLYQLHWPARGHYHFRRNWAYCPSDRDAAAERQRLADTLGALGREVDAGRIRAIGLSNDTAWGVTEMLRLAAAEGLPRVASIQNEYSLLYRLFDTDLAEVAHYEDVGLLAYSPLATGILSGKYSGMVVPEDSRGKQVPGLSGRLTDAAAEAADRYAALARDHGVEPVQMALAFVLSRPFTTAAIIGATSLAQLDLALGAAEVRLSDAVSEGIAALHRAYPMPY